MEELHPDVAYLLGLIVARGEIGHGVIRIHFPYKSKELNGYDVERSMIVSLNTIRERLGRLVYDIYQEQTTFILRFKPTAMDFRWLKALLRGRTSHYRFEIPQEIFNSDIEIKKEFIRGYADIAGSVRRFNRDWSGMHRVQLDILNENWTLPVQLCYLLQCHLEIPVHTIDWGVPPKRTGKEHQLKVYVNDFQKVGFYIQHKREAIGELLLENQKRGFKGTSFCYERKRRIGRKVEIPDQEGFPVQIRGKTFSHYTEICVALGCTVKDRKCNDEE